MPPAYCALKRAISAAAVLISLTVTAFPTGTRADVVQLREDHPERYIVERGDTLWDIAARFLRSPWHWPRIWKINQQIANPHLIYPGDVIVFRYVDGKPELSLLRSQKLAPEGVPSPAPDSAPFVPAPSGIPTVKLSPGVRSQPLHAAIPTIPPNAIVPFLTQPLAVGEKELNDAGYITVGLDDRIALGDHSEFYARGTADDDQEFYQIFRQGNPIRDPDTGEVLAFEAIYLGDAQRLATGDPTKFVVTRVKQEIVPTDRLLAAPKTPALPYYYPHPPEAKIEGRIVSALNAVAEVGPFTVVAINRGQREGIEEGHVLRIMRHVGERQDPLTRAQYKLPDEQSGVLMVFRTFEKVSFGLIMSATQPVHIHDTVVTP